MREDVLGEVPEEGRGTSTSLDEKGEERMLEGCQMCG